LLHWAWERARLDPDTLVKRFPQLEEWETGERQPTLKQLEDFAKATLTPFGYFFLPEPPEETLPIPDFRTVASRAVRRPSAQLLETLNICIRRQEWYREHALAEEQAPLAFIGGSRIADGVEAVAAAIRAVVRLDPDARRTAKDGDAALRAMFEQVEEAGILVMRNGVVGNNTSQPLSVEEFRGFALSDPHAPLVFINAADTKAAQMFTLAHELAHLWLGESGISNSEETLAPSGAATEAFCNRVAAEALVPMRDFRAVWNENADPVAEFRRLATRFRVSTLVIIRRAHDAGFLSAESFNIAYKDELDRIMRFARGSGGDFYKTQTSRLGRRFPRALLESTLGGATLYRDAFRLLGISKTETFEKLARELRFAI